MTLEQHLRMASEVGELGGKGSRWSREHPQRPRGKHAGFLRNSGARVSGTRGKGEQGGAREIRGGSR